MGYAINVRMYRAKIPLDDPMRKRCQPISLWITLGVGFLALSGCTREKAEAIKVAAQNFRAEAAAGVEILRILLK